MFPFFLPPFRPSNVNVDPLLDLVARSSPFASPPPTTDPTAGLTSQDLSLGIELFQAMPDELDETDLDRSLPAFEREGGGGGSAAA